MKRETNVLSEVRKRRRSTKASDSRPFCVKNIIVNFDGMTERRLSARTMLKPLSVKSWWTSLKVLVVPLYRSLVVCSECREYYVYHVQINNINCVQCWRESIALK